MLHAVLIGVNAPRDGKILPAEFARADAEELADVLAEQSDTELRTTLLVEEEATKSAIARVMTDDLPRRVSPEDNVLFYFAGYGSPEIEGVEPEPSIHLAVYDTEQSRLHATSINVLSELTTWTRRLPARTVAMILDTSFNGLPGGRTFEGPGLRSGPRTRALDRISPSRAAVGAHYALLTACGEKEVAREEPAYEHGVFTYHLLAALRSWELQSRPASLATLHRAVCDELDKTPNRHQHPGLHGRGVDAPIFSFEASRLDRPRSSSVATGHAIP